MQQATKAAQMAIYEFTEDPEAQERIRVYLSEIPIGDEYEILSDSDIDLGRRFEKFCEKLGITVFGELIYRDGRFVLLNEDKL